MSVNRKDLERRMKKWIDDTIGISLIDGDYVNYHYLDVWEVKWKRRIVSDVEKEIASRQTGFYFFSAFLVTFAFLIMFFILPSLDKILVLMHLI